MARVLAVVVVLAWQLSVATTAQAASAGDLDRSFGMDGKVTTNFVSSFGVVRALVVQGRKVVAAGLVGDDFGLARYKSNGSLDRSFGTDGKVTTNIIGSSSPDEANALVQQADGKLVAAGRTFSEVGGVFDFALARYNSNGTLDPSFGTGGLVTTDFAGTSDNARALVWQPDGKLVAAGGTDTFTGSDFALARYNSDGSLDPSFGIGGLVTTDIGAANINEANALVRQANGKLVAAGVAVGPSGSTDFALARYNSDGTLDPSFGTGGLVITDIGGNDDSARALAVQANGKLVAAGFDSSVFGNSAALARYNPDGTLDTSFGAGGTVTTGPELTFALVVQADGKLVAGGVAGQNFGLARYNPNGTMDTSFGAGGTVTTDFAGGSDAVRALALQADGMLVAAGESGPCCDFALARYRTR